MPQLASQKRCGERDRIHEHYLKGSLRCGQCYSRLLFTKVTGHGGTYDYFFCLGRQRGNHGWSALVVDE